MLDSLYPGRPSQTPAAAMATEVEIDARKASQEGAGEAMIGRRYQRPGDYPPAHPRALRSHKKCKADRAAIDRIVKDIRAWAREVTVVMRAVLAPFTTQLKIPGAQ